MVDSSREEQRALTPDELELVSAARHPALSRMGADELAELVRKLGELARPAAAARVEDEESTRGRQHFLAAALSRAEDEVRRRQGAPHGNP